MFPERVRRCVSPSAILVPPLNLWVFVDASDILRENPFPNVLRVCCDRTGDEDDFYDEKHEHEHRLFSVSEGLLQSFHVCLGLSFWTIYLMPAADRGLDNFSETLTTKKLPLTHLK